MSGTLLWLFSPTWGAGELILEVGIICPSPFLVIDPIDFIATITVAQVLCLIIFNVSPTKLSAIRTNTLRLEVT